MATTVYYNIKSEIISRCANCSYDNFQLLKERFRNDINSVRRFDNINNVEQLIKILEKRNVVNKNDLKRMIEIACHIDFDHMDWIKCTNSSNGNVLLQQRASAIPSNYIQNPLSSLPPSAPVFNHPGRQSIKDRIYEYVMRHIGYKWKTLARSLDMSEGDIDNLEERYKNDPSERVYQILLHYEKLCPRSWHKLLEALNVCRRSDMHEYIIKNIIDN